MFGFSRLMAPVLMLVIKLLLLLHVVHSYTNYMLLVGTPRYAAKSRPPTTAQSHSVWGVNIIWFTGAWKTQHPHPNY